MVIKIVHFGSKIHTNKQEHQLVGDLIIYNVIIYAADNDSLQFSDKQWTSQNMKRTEARTACWNHRCVSGSRVSHVGLVLMRQEGVQY